MLSQEKEGKVIEDPDPMSPAQRQAIQKAWDILTEHFDHVVVVADWDIEEDGKTKNAHEVWWHGGSMAAIGMCEYGSDRLMRSGEKSREPDDE